MMFTYKKQKAYTTMPSVLLPEVIAKQEELERKTDHELNHPTDESVCPCCKVLDWFLTIKRSDSDYDLDWWETGAWDCKTVEREEDIIQEGLGLPERMKKYFDVRQLLLDEWKFGACNSDDDQVYLVYRDHTDGNILLEEVPENYPAWKHRVEEFFRDVPGNKMFVIRRA